MHRCKLLVNKLGWVGPSVNEPTSIESTSLTNFIMGLYSTKKKG